MDSAHGHGESVHISLGHEALRLLWAREFPSHVRVVRRWMPVFRALTLPIMRRPEEGADTIVWLGAAPEPLAGTGRFWHDRRPRPTHYALGASPDDAAARAALWRTCEELAGEGAAEGSQTRSPASDAG